MTFPRVKLTKHGKEEPSGFRWPDATYTSLDLSIYHPGTLLNQENHKGQEKGERKGKDKWKLGIRESSESVGTQQSTGCSGETQTCRKLKHTSDHSGDWRGLPGWEESRVPLSLSVPPS